MGTVFSTVKYTPDGVPYYSLKDFSKLKKLDKGGFSIVYKGYGYIENGQNKKKQAVAIKAFDELNNYSKREIEILKTLNHPNLIQLFGVIWHGKSNPSSGKISDYSGYVMEYMEFGSLHKVIHDQFEIYDTKEIVMWTRQIATGLRFLHDHEIIHRDINPRNILFAAKDHLKLADLGLAKDACNLTATDCENLKKSIMSDCKGSSTRTAGTGIYTAPEVFNKKSAYGSPADVYSLGVTIWEIIYRKYPGLHVKPITDGFLFPTETYGFDEIKEAIVELVNRCVRTNSSERPSIHKILSLFDAHYTASDFKGKLNNGRYGSLFTGFVKDDREVSLKMCIGEARIFKKLRWFFIPDHPNIMKIVGVVSNLDIQHSKPKYIGYFMEFMSCGNLHEIIHNDSKIYEMDLIVTWIKQICSGLNHLYGYGIVHGAIKPQNILIAAEGKNLKLADFGLPRNISASGLHRTSQDVIDPYTAPEVRGTEKEYGRSIDVYSLGTTIWELIHRMHPHEELKISKDKGSHYYSLPMDPDILDEDSAEFLQRCWHISTKRPTVEEILEFGRRLYDCSSLLKLPDYYIKEGTITKYFINNRQIVFVTDTDGKGIRKERDLYCVPKILRSYQMRAFAETSVNFARMLMDRSCFLYEDWLVEDDKIFAWLNKRQTIFMTDIAVREKRRAVVVKKYEGLDIYCKKEIEMLQTLNHPNIVKLLGVIWDTKNSNNSPKCSGYVMEYIRRGSLYRIIHNRYKAYDRRVVLGWIRQIGRGLQYLHEHDIIYRNMNPRKILISARNNIKLANFKRARKISTRYTYTSRLIGIGAYRAPEVLASKDYCPSTDIYSMGVTIWEIIHREHPGTHTKRRTDSQGNVRVQLPIETDEFEKMEKSLVELLKRCLQPIASARPSIYEITGFTSSLQTILLMGHSILVILNDDRFKWIMLQLKPPHSTCNCGAVYLNGEIYLVGESGGYKKALYKLDKNLKWIRLADMNIGRSNITNACVVLNGQIWVFGGLTGSIEDSKSVEKYDPRENKWTRMPDMKHPRYNPTAVLCNDNIIISGDSDKNIDCYNPKDGSWMEFPNPYYKAHSVVSYKNRIIVMGGKDIYWQNLNDVYELDPLDENTKWKQLPSMKHPYNDFTARILDNEIYALGGRMDFENLDRVEIFDGENWRNGPSLPAGYQGMPAVVIPQDLADRLYNFSRHNKQ